MAYDRRHVTALAVLFGLGVLLRFSLAGVNPPNNSYDDHLEPVALYADDSGRPAPDACWQCYQPPVFYWIAAEVATVAEAMWADTRAAWEAVQWISAVASVATLIFCLLLLRLYLPEDGLAALAGLTAVIMLPRELYTAATLSNDALLVCFVSAAIYGFARIERAEDLRWGVPILGASVVLAAWTKQSGLAAMVLLGFAGWTIWWRTDSGARRLILLSVLALAGVLAVADEVWRTYQTGIPLVSNQHLEYRALHQDQPPGHVSLSTFASFLPIQLWEHSTLHPSTVDSFWTQIFARSWFDYEPRYLPSGPATLWLARGLYVVGGVATLVTLAGAAYVVRRGPNSARKLLTIPAGFLGAAIMQTVRFPHFSSMKALFVLPAVAMFTLCFAYGVKALRTRQWGRQCVIGLLTGLVVLGVLHGAAALWWNDAALNLATSPLWPIPPL